MNRALIAACLTLSLTACEFSCKPLSESVGNAGAELNGGFELAHDGLPAGWNVYTPRTVPGAEFEIALDEGEAREGARALRFDVTACGDEGGWRSPGLSREIEVEPGATYAVSFQVRCEACRWSASWGGVDAKTGELETVDTSPCAEGDWRRVEARYTVPERYDRLRLEFNVLSPGRLWLDDVRVERVGA